MAKWYVQQETDVLGPFTPQELLALVRRGTVTTQTKLRKDDSPWFPAQEVGGLFDAAVRPTVVYHCPGCGAVVQQPPCLCVGCGRQLEVANRQTIQNRIATATDVAKASGISQSMQNWLSKVKRKPS